ncbi:MAG: hypothetical protein SNJ55_06455 [Chloroherpetonaceae bacterium]
MKRLKFTLILCAVAIFGCNNSDTPIFSEYPLSVGNRWEYERVFRSENFRPINDTSTYGGFTYASPITVEILKKTRLRDGQEVLEFRSTQGFVIGYSYINQTGEGLFTYAHGASPSDIPRNAPIRFSLKGITLASVEELLSMMKGEVQAIANRGDDTLFYENPPVKSFHFPYQKNFKWAMRESSPFRIEKEYVGNESVSTPLGIQNCVKTKWYWDINGDGIYDLDIEGYDYLNQNGLIKREFFIKDVLVQNSTTDSIGFIDIRDTYQINSFSIR